MAHVRRRWSAALVLSLFGVSSLVAQAAVPGEPRYEGDDPHQYIEPHAGYVAPPRAPGKLVPATGTLLGTHSDDNHSGELNATDQKILVTEEISGRTMDIDNSYYGGFTDFANDYEPGNPNKRGLSKLAFWDIEQGRIPLVGWGCGRSSAITAGDYDDVITETAEAMKAFGHEFFLRYCWEMDGDKRSEPGPAAQFTEAWIHIWTIFKNVGADNVIWVWCANADHFKHQTDRGEWAWDYYPGDKYVDWVSADGYNWAASYRNRDDNYNKDRWRGFIEIFDEFMVWARSTGSVPQTMIDASSSDRVPAAFPRKGAVKPIMIGEYGAIQPEGSIADHYLQISEHNTKEAWLRETHDAVNGTKPRTAECDWCGIFSDIAALVYFDVEGVNGNWYIHDYPEAEKAWREAAQDPWYNQIHTLGWAPAANRPGAPTVITTPPGPVPAPSPQPVQVPPVGQDGSVSGAGYWMLGAGGAVYPFGDAGTHGDVAAHLPAPAQTAAVDLESTPSGAGYWVTDSAGRVFAMGDAGHFGNAEAAKLVGGEKVISLSSTPSAKGYWLFTNRGRAMAFGDAAHHGDMSATRLNAPVLDSIPSATGKGYYMVAGDGGIFTFGDAKFSGSMGDKKLNAPVQSLVPDHDGKGYWLVASDGGVFAFDAPFRGSMGGTRLNKPMTGMVPYGDGYLMVAEDGGIFNFSDKPFSGSLGATRIPHPIVAVTAVR